MHPVYFSHPYARNESEARLVAYFGVLLRRRGFLPKLDPPSDDVNAAKLERQLSYTSGLIGILTEREGGPSPYIRYEIGMALRASKPVLVFVEDSLPNGLVPTRAMQRRFSSGSIAFETLEHDNALDILATYVGERPLPRYEPPREQRTCVLIGTRTLGPDRHRGLVDLLKLRGYGVLVPTAEQARSDPWAMHSAAAASQLAIAVVEGSDTFAAYLAGYLKAALVPTIEFTSATSEASALGVPAEFRPRRLVSKTTDEFCHEAAAQVDLFEEDFLDLEPEKADEYARMLLDTGGPTRYTDTLRNQFVQEITVGDKFEITGDVGVAAARGSHIHDISFVKTWNTAKTDIDIEQLARELATLRAELKRTAETPEQDASVGAVASAEVSAKEGNGPTTLEWLAKAGKWVLDTALKIGTPVAAAAIKAALGL